MSTWIRHTQPWGFRTGTWAEITGVRMVTTLGFDRPSFLVQFADGVRDLWAIYDDIKAYEFSDAEPAPGVPVDTEATPAGGETR